MKKHIAIFIGSAIDDIIAGRKTIESRFSLSRVLPYNQVSKDDIILLKKSGGDIIGQVTVDNVLFYDNLNKGSISILKREYGDQIFAQAEYWQKKMASKYGSLIFLKKPKRFAFPIKFTKKDRRPWLVLDEKKSRESVSRLVE